MEIIDKNYLADEEVESFIQQLNEYNLFDIILFEELIADIGEELKRRSTQPIDTNEYREIIAKLFNIYSYTISRCVSHFDTIDFISVIKNLPDNYSTCLERLKLSLEMVIDQNYTRYSELIDESNWD